MAREFLSSKGVAFEVKDLAENPAYRQEILELTNGVPGVPLFVIDNLVLRRPDRQTLAAALGLEA